VNTTYLGVRDGKALGASINHDPDNTDNMIW